VADFTPRIADSEGVDEAFDAQAIMSANEETVKSEQQEKAEQQEQPEKLEQQAAAEPRKSEDSQSSSDIEEKHTEEEQRPVSRDGSDKDTVCPLPSSETSAVNSSAPRLPTRN
jgi:hypothetical protein